MIAVLQVDQNAAQTLLYAASALMAAGLLFALAAIVATVRDWLDDRRLSRTTSLVTPFTREQLQRAADRARELERAADHIAEAAGRKG